MSESEGKSPKMTYDPRYYLKKCHLCGKESANRTLINIEPAKSTKKRFVFLCRECAKDYE